MKKSTFICLILMSFLACKEAPKNTSTTTPTDKVAEVPTDKGGVQNDSDLVAVTDAIHSFYKWYEAFIDDNKRSIEYINSKGKTSKLDNTKLAAYHAELMKSGFISKAYIDNDVAYLKKYEAEWTKNKENGNEGPLSGLDFDRVFCGQDWDIKAFTTGAVKAEGLGTNQVKATVEASKLELVKENGKWLISKIICE
jgi:Protein of unknown function (DUF3828)